MFSVWTLSSLILSCSLAFPIFTNSSNGSDMESFSNDTEKNFAIFKTNVTSGSDMERFSASRPRPVPRCLLASCALDNLVDDMQTGDEKAGGSTHDPWGPGKK